MFPSPRSVPTPARPPRPSDEARLGSGLWDPDFGYEAVMSGGDVLEREIKFTADPEFDLPDLRDLLTQTVRQPEQHLMATYFDTSDLSLWRHGITLRHRTGEGPGEGVWTLKLPEARTDDALNRRELTWAGRSDTVPDRARDVLRGLVRHGALEEVAVIETRRRRLVLHGGHGAVLGELDDDTVTIHGGDHDGRRFREIELELEDGDDGLVAAVLERLRQAGARPEPAGPKLARALDAGAPGPETVRPVGADATLAEVAQSCIGTGLHRLLDHEYRLRVDQDDPPAHDIHQARVACRRLRSDLKTFGDLLDPAWVRHVRADLNWLGDALGRVRDLDVLTDELKRQLSQGSVDLIGATEIVGVLRRRRMEAARDLAAVLEDERYGVVLGKLHAAASRPPLLHPGRRSRNGAPDRRASVALPRVVRRPWKKLRRQVGRAGRCPTDQQLHRIRIRAKQLRYACEAAEPVIGGRARRMAKHAEAIQTRLGEHHDAAEAEKWLRAEAADRTQDFVFTAGQLTGEERRRQMATSRRWRSDWKKLKRKQTSGWLA